MSNQQSTITDSNRICEFHNFRITSKDKNLTKKSIQALELWIQSMEASYKNANVNACMIVALTTGDKNNHLLQCWRNAYSPYSEETPQYGLKKFNPSMNTSFPNPDAKEGVQKEEDKWIHVEGAMENTRHMERLMDLADVIKRFPQHIFVIQSLGYFTVVGKEGFYQMPGLWRFTEEYLNSRHADENITFEAAIPNLFFSVHVASDKMFPKIASAFMYDYYKEIELKTKKVGEKRISKWVETANWKWYRKNLNVRRIFYLSYDKRWNVYKGLDFWKTIKNSWIIVNPSKYPKTSLRELRKFCEMLIDKGCGVYIDFMPKVWRTHQIELLEAERKDIGDEATDKAIKAIQNNEDSVIPDSLKQYRMFPGIHLPIQFTSEMPHAHKDAWSMDELKFRFQRFKQKEMPLTEKELAVQT